MPRFTRAYQSPLMAAADLAEGDLLLTIHDARDQLVGQGTTQKTKVVLTFKDHNHKLALNSTNYKAIVSMFGPDLDDWSGRTIGLTVGEATYGGETVDAIRVKMPTRRTSRPAHSQAADVRYTPPSGPRVPDIPPSGPVSEEDESPDSPF